MYAGGLFAWNGELEIEVGIAGCRFQALGHHHWAQLGASVYGRAWGGVASEMQVLVQVQVQVARWRQKRSSAKGKSGVSEYSYILNVEYLNNMQGSAVGDENYRRSETLLGTAAGSVLVSESVDGRTVVMMMMMMAMMEDTVVVVLC